MAAAKLAAGFSELRRCAGYDATYLTFHDFESGCRQTNLSQMTALLFSLTTEIQHISHASDCWHCLQPRIDATEVPSCQVRIFFRQRISFQFERPVVGDQLACSPVPPFSAGGLENCETQFPKIAISPQPCIPRVQHRCCVRRTGRVSNLSTLVFATLLLSRNHHRHAGFVVWFVWPFAFAVWAFSLEVPMVRSCHLSEKRRFASLRPMWHVGVPGHGRHRCQ